MRRCSHPLVLIFSCSNYKPQESIVNNSSGAVNGFFCLPQRRIIFHLSVQRFSDHQMGKNLPFILVVLWILLRIHGDPRSNTMEIICLTQLEHNTTSLRPEFHRGHADHRRQDSIFRLWHFRGGLRPRCKFRFCSVLRRSFSSRLRPLRSFSSRLPSASG